MGAQLVDVKHLPHEAIFIVTAPLEGWSIKAKGAASSHAASPQPSISMSLDESKAVFSAVLHPKLFSVLTYHYEHINT